MGLPLAIVFLLVGFVILIKGADMLVEGASAVAKRFNISDLIIGLTIVSFGTSAPELVVNINAAIAGSNAMIFGNVLGSNIYNTCLILGVAGIIYPLAVQRNTAFKEFPFSLGIIMLVYVLGNDMRVFGASENEFSRIDGGILLLLFGCFLFYIYRGAKNNPEESDEEIELMSSGKSTLWIVLGMVGLVAGGKMVLDGAVTIAEAAQMPERVIGLTVVAIGTSLPELATSAVAALKKNSDIAVGNVIGSNIFNVLLVLSVSTIVSPVDYDPASNFDIYFLMGATVLLFFFLFIGTRAKGGRYVVDRWQAVILFVAVVAYTIYLVVTSIGTVSGLAADFKKAIVSDKDKSITWVNDLAGSYTFKEDGTLVAEPTGAGKWKVEKKKVEDKEEEVFMLKIGEGEWQEKTLEIKENALVIGGAEYKKPE